VILAYEPAKLPLAHPADCCLAAFLLQSGVLRSCRQPVGRAVRDPLRRYSITSSAIASSVGGTSRPRALAVLRLMTNSNLVGNCTGRSPGFAPLRMRSI